MRTEAIALVVLVLPHLIGGVFLGWWILPTSAKSELRGWFRDDDGGSQPLAPVTPSRGGGDAPLPLPDAVPTAVRMREPGRLGELRPAPARRPHAPVDPVRRPERLPR